MKRTTIAALIITVFAVEAFAREGGCAQLVTGSEQRGKGKFEASFSATEVLDVDVWVLFHPGAVKALSGDHDLEIRFFTPGGFLYQSTSIPFTESPSAKGKARKLDGYPHPIDVSVLESVSWMKGKYYGTKVRLPIAGTLVMTNGLYGEWRAEAYLDGAEVKCAAPATFTITP